MKLIRHQTLSRGLFAAVLSAAVPFVSLSQTKNIEPTCGLSVYGDWLMPDGISVVSIQDCEADKVCGNISFLSDPNFTDSHNADPTLRDRKLLGADLLSDFSLGSKNKYKGKIYNPEDGKTYKSIIKRVENDRLKVKGCLGPFCQTQFWSRPEICGQE